MKAEMHDLATHKEKDKNDSYEGHSLMIITIIKKKHVVGFCLAQHKRTRPKIERDALGKRRQK